MPSNFNAGDGEVFTDDAFLGAVSKDEEIARKAEAQKAAMAMRAQVRETAPEAPEAPATPATPEEDPEVDAWYTDMLKAIPRGIIKNGADAIDTMAEVFAELMPAAAANPGMGGASPRAQMYRLMGQNAGIKSDQKTVRESADELVGESDTTAGLVTEELAAAVVAMFPAVRASKGLTWGKQAIAGASAGMGYDALTTNAEDGNLGNASEALFGSNWYGDVMAIRPDDSVWERAIKSIPEGVVLGGALDVGANAIGRLITKTKGLNKAADGVAEVARIPADQKHAGFEKAINDALNAHLSDLTTDQADLVARAEENLVAVATAAVEEGTVSDAYLAAYRRVIEDVVSPETTAAMKGLETVAVDDYAIHIDVVDKAHAKAVGLPESAKERAKLVAEQGWASPSDTTNATIGGQSPWRNLRDGDTVHIFKRSDVDEANSYPGMGKIRQGAKPVITVRGTAGETPESLIRRGVGAAPAPPERQVLNNFVSIPTEDLLRLGSAVRAGDIALAAEHLDAFYTPVNFNNIIAQEDGLEKLANTMADITGDLPGHLGDQDTVRWATTDEESWGMLKSYADKYGGDWEKVAGTLGDMLPGRGLTKAFNAFRMLHASLGMKVQKLAMQYADTVTDEGMLAITNKDRADFLRYLRLYGQVQDKLAGTTTAVARTTRSMGMVVGDYNFDQVMTGAFREADLMDLEMIDSAGGAEAVDRLILGTSVPGATPNGAAAGAAHPHALSDMVYELYVNNLLSSLNTQSTNLTSNSIRGLMWEPMAEGLNSTIRSVFKANPQEFRSFWGYYQGQAAGMMNAFRAASRLRGRASSLSAGSAWRSFQRGSRETATSMKFNDTQRLNTTLSTQSFGNWATDERGFYVRRPFMGGAHILPDGTRAIRQGVDTFWRSAEDMGVDKAARLAVDSGAFVLNAFGRALGWTRSTMAYMDEVAAAGALRARVQSNVWKMALGSADAKIAMKKGGRKARSQFVAKRAEELMHDFDMRMELEGQYAQAVMEGDEEAMARIGARVRQNKKLLAAGEREAKAVTYTTEPDKLTQAAITVKENVPTVRFFMEFVNTPVNLYKSGFFDLSGLKPAARAVLSVHKPGSQEFTENLSRFIMGGTIVHQGFTLIDEGRLTGAYPQNPQQRDVWIADGIPEYSVKIGDKWYPYLRMSPFAIPVSLIADAKQIIDAHGSRLGTQTVDELMGALVTGFFHNLKAQSWVHGVMDVLDLFDNEQAFGSRMRAKVSDVGANLIPSSRLLASYQKTQDNQRYMNDDSGSLAQQMYTRMASQMPDEVTAVFEPLFRLLGEIDPEQNKYPHRDIWYNVRTWAPGVGPDIAAPFNYVDGELDPVSDELTKLGFAWSVEARFGKVNVEGESVKLTPKQQARFQRLFHDLGDNHQPIYEKVKNMIFKSDGTYREKWLQWSGVTPGMPSRRADEVTKVMATRYARAMKKLIREDEELNALSRQRRRQKHRARTEAGSVQVFEEMKKAQQ